MKNINQYFNKTELRTIIKSMNDNDADFNVTGDLMVFSFLSKDDKPLFYGFRKKDDFLIGKGGYGEIYKAYAIDPISYQPIRDKFIVIKEIDSREFSQSEFNIGSSSIGMYEPIEYRNYTYIAQPFLGSSLKNNPEIKKLSPKNLLSLIKNLVFKMNELHHPTLRSGMAVAHGDVKMQNILVKFIYDSHSQLKDIEINFIDFGLSASLEKKQVYAEDQKTYRVADDNPQKLHRFSIVGNEYFPQETKTGTPRFGVKSDIYQLAAVIAELLGARDRGFGSWVFTQPKYSQTELSKLPDFKFGDKVNKLVVDFINKMRHQKYVSRPTSDETCKFFFALSNFYKAQAANNKTAAAAIIDTLTSLTDGSWSQERDYKTSYNSSSSDESAEGAGSHSRTDTSTSISISGNSFSTFAKPSIATPTGTLEVTNHEEIVCLL